MLKGVNVSLRTDVIQEPMLLVSLLLYRFGVVGS